jgi:hypothetical protein
VVLRVSIIIVKFVIVFLPRPFPSRKLRSYETPNLSVSSP